MNMNITNLLRYVAIAGLLWLPAMLAAKGGGPLDRILSERNMIVAGQITEAAETGWIELRNPRRLHGSEEIVARMRLPVAVTAQLSPTQRYLLVYTRWERAGKPEQYRLDRRGAEVVNLAGVGWLIFPSSESLRHLLSGNADGWPDQPQRVVSSLAPLLDRESPSRTRAMLAPMLLFNPQLRDVLVEDTKRVLRAWARDPRTGDETRVQLLNSAAVIASGDIDSQAWRLATCRPVVAQPALDMPLGHPRWGLVRTCAGVLGREGDAASDWPAMEALLVATNHFVAETAAQALLRWTPARARQAIGSRLDGDLLAPETRNTLRRLIANGAD